MKNVKANKCCFKYKNQIVLSYAFGCVWSYMCKECGRYTYDYNGCQLSVKESLERINWCLKLMSYYRKNKTIKEINKMN